MSSDLTNRVWEHLEKAKEAVTTHDKDFHIRQAQQLTVALETNRDPSYSISVGRFDLEEISDVHSLEESSGELLVYGDGPGEYWITAGNPVDLEGER